MTYKYMNMFTGELYRNLWHALFTIVLDMMHCPACRSLAMFRLEKGQW